MTEAPIIADRDIIYPARTKCKRCDASDPAVLYAQLSVYNTSSVLSAFLFKDPT